MRHFWMFKFCNVCLRGLSKSTLEAVSNPRTKGEVAAFKKKFARNAISGHAAAKQTYNTFARKRKNLYIKD